MHSGPGIALLIIQIFDFLTCIFEFLIHRHNQTQTPPSLYYWFFSSNFQSTNFQSKRKIWLEPSILISESVVWSWETSIFGIKLIYFEIQNHKSPRLQAWFLPSTSQWEILLLLSGTLLSSWLLFSLNQSHIKGVKMVQLKLIFFDIPTHSSP